MSEATDFKEAPLFISGATIVVGDKRNNSSSNGVVKQQHKESSQKQEDREHDEYLKDVPLELTKRYYFGCGPCHPKWLQIFAQKKLFTILLCGFAFLQGAIVSGELLIYLQANSLHMYIYVIHTYSVA